MSARPAILFDERAHRYSVNGVPYPSVTQVMQRHLEDFSGIDPATLEYARIRGQHVHAAMALLVREELDWDALDPTLRPYIEGGRRFLEESGVTVIASECRVASVRLRLAGTLDLVAHWRNAEAVMDFKACDVMPPSVGPQTAAYERLYCLCYGGAERRRYCVQLKPGDYRVTPCADKNDWNIFQSALNCHQWMQRHHANAA